MDRVLKDERFVHIARDSRFRPVPKNERKVKIDKRFQAMFTDSRFKAKNDVDKRGRPQNFSNEEDLKKFYHLSSSEEGESDDDEEEDDDDDDYEDNKSVKANTANKIPVTAKQAKAKFKQELSESDAESDERDDTEKAKVSVDLARGLGNEDSSSSDESSSDEEDGIEHPWGELGSNAPAAEEITNRLAVCNIDWDRISANDLFLLLNSFTPQGGSILFVMIYLSDFGRERMKEEEIKGPKELTEASRSEETLAEDPDGEKHQMEKLRMYQLNRLKYYYAVVKCDSPNTANKIYEECDGLEFETSASRLDLRFIPNDMTFEEEPHSVATKSSDLKSYQAKKFITTALQQSTVRLTWDETNPDRTQRMQRLFNKGEEIDDDLKAYLASSSESSEEEDEDKTADLSSSVDDVDEEDKIAKYRSLLQDTVKKDNEIENDDVKMEITWAADLKEKTQSLVKKKLEEKEELTPFQQTLKKMKEKRKLKKLSKKSKEINKSVESSDEKDKPFSDDELPPDVDLDDPFFRDVSDDNSGKKKNKKSEGKIKPLEETEEEKQAKANLELLLMDNEQDSRHHFNLDKIMKNESGNKKKRRKNKQPEIGQKEKPDSFQMDVHDDRFSAIFTSHHYNIDPSNPQFKSTKSMKLLIEENQKRKSQMRESQQALPKKLKSDESLTDKPNKESATQKAAELSLLVNSVKSKTLNFKQKRKQKSTIH